MEGKARGDTGRRGEEREGKGRIVKARQMTRERESL